MSYIYGPPAHTTSIGATPYSTLYPYVSPPSDPSRSLSSYGSPPSQTQPSSRTKSRPALSTLIQQTPPGSPFRRNATPENQYTAPFVPNAPLQTDHLQEHGFPKFCTRIPQLTYREPVSSFPSMADADFRWPCVVFRQDGSSGLGVCVGDVLHAKARGNLRNLGLGCSDDKVFRRRGGDGQIKLRISWPGYRLDPSEQRINTIEASMTREALVIAIAEHVNNFTEWIRRNNIPVERGQERWAIGMHPDGSKGIDGSDVVITALHHCGRSNWQAELWLPDRLVKEALSRLELGRKQSLQG